MRPINQQQRDHARNLFFQSGKTRAQIAEEVGVSERSISLWTKEGDWKRLRSASKLMPSLIVENFYSQVQELNDNIRNREPGMRFPTLQEAEVFRKLVLTAERMNKRKTQGEYIEMFQKFLQWMAPQNHDQVQLFTTYADGFLKSRSVEGFHPYDIEYAQPEPPLPSIIASLQAIPPSSGDSPTSTNAEHGQGDVEPGPPLQANQDSTFPLLRGDVPETTNVVSEQGCVQPSPAPQPEQNDILHNTSLSFGEGRGEASLAQDTPEVTPSPLVEKGPGDEIKSAITRTLSLLPLKDESAITGNNSPESYEAPTNTSNETDQPKGEITNEQEITQIPLLRGDSSNSTNVESEQGCVQSSKEPKPNKDSSVEIGYLGQKQKPERGDAVMITIQQDDPDIQRFSIGNAIYYIRKKE